jgi:NADPH2:quinone reductase
MSVASSRTVRAARLHKHGEPLVVEDVQLRAPGGGEVVVEMAYAGVNPVDRYGAVGTVAADSPLPRTLGSEGSGLLDGRAVLVRGSGLYAGAAVVRESSLIAIPPGVGLTVAAALGIAGVTAWRTVTELAEVAAHDRVLVLGASGGVGSMIVSLVDSLGATVWGQTASAAKADFVKQSGAGRVVVATSPDDLVEVAAELRPTVVFDPLGGGYSGAAVAALQPRGRLVLFGTSADAVGLVPLQALYRKSLRVLGYGGLMETEPAIRSGIEAALAAVADGRLRVTIDSVLPLEQVNTAFARLVDRSVSGKLVLDVRS